MAFETGDLISVLSAGLFQEAVSGTPTVTSITPTSGRMNQYVEIEGSRFGASGFAFISTIPLRIQSFSDTIIKGFLDAGLTADTYDVIVYNGVTKKTGVLSDGFTITAPSGETARTKIRRAVKYGLQQLTLANGFRNTMFRVYDPPMNIEDMSEFPSCNLLWGDEFQTNRTVIGNNNLLDLEFTAEMDIFLHERNDPALEQDKTIADIQEWFGKKFYIPGETGDRTAFNCLYEGCTPFGTDSTVPACGVTVRYKVWYRIKVTDPDTIN